MSTLRDISKWNLLVLGDNQSDRFSFANEDVDSNRGTINSSFTTTSDSWTNPRVRGRACNLASYGRCRWSEKRFLGLRSRPRGPEKPYASANRAARFLRRGLHPIPNKLSFIHAECRRAMPCRIVPCRIVPRDGSQSKCNRGPFDETEAQSASVRFVTTSGVQARPWRDFSADTRERAACK